VASAGAPAPSPDHPAVPADGIVLGNERDFCRVLARVDTPALIEPSGEEKVS
jgi:hypothetical protein